MAVFFFVLLPLAVLAAAVLLLWLGRASRIASVLAMLIIASPFIGMAYWGVREVRTSLGGSDLRSGRGYFTGRDPPGW